MAVDPDGLARSKCTVLGPLGARSPLMASSVTPNRVEESEVGEDPGPESAGEPGLGRQAGLMPTQGTFSVSVVLTFV